MIQKKKFSDAIAANISVVGGLIGNATFNKDGLMPSGQYIEDTQVSNKKYIILHKSIYQWSLDRFFFSIGNGSAESLIYITIYNMTGTVKAKYIHKGHSFRLLYKKEGNTMEVYLAQSTPGNTFNNMYISKTPIRSNASDSAIANIDDIGDESSFTEATILEP